MASITDLGALGWECLECVARYVPAAFDVFPFPKLKETLDSSRGAKDAWKGCLANNTKRTKSLGLDTSRYIAKVRYSSCCGVDMATNCIDVDAIADENSFLAHIMNGAVWFTARVSSERLP